MAIKIKDSNAQFQINKNRMIVNPNFNFSGGFDNVTMPTLAGIVMNSLFHYDFGHAIAIGDGKIVVGAPSGGSSDDNSGTAYLLDYDLSTVTELANGGRALNDEFGRQVAIGYGRIAVGIIGRTGSTQVPYTGGQPGTDLNDFEGAVYLYDSADGSFIKEIRPPVEDRPKYVGSGAGEISFGKTVLIAGGRIIVSQSTDPFNSNDPENPTGFVKFFIYDMDGNLITKFRTPAGTVYDVGAKTDGNRIVVPVQGDLSFTAGANIHDLSGTFIKTITYLDTDITPTNSPTQPAVAISNGIIFLSYYVWEDSDGYSQKGIIFKFDYDGNYLGKIEHPTPADNNRFGQYMTAGDGRLYVPNTANAVDNEGVFIYDVDGNYIGLLNPTNNTVNSVQYDSSKDFGTYSSIAVADGLLLIGDPDFAEAHTEGGRGAVYAFTTPTIKDSLNDIDKLYKRAPITSTLPETITLSGIEPFPNTLYSFGLGIADLGWKFRNDGSVLEFNGGNTTFRGGIEWCSNNPPNGIWYIRATSVQGYQTPNDSNNDPLNTWLSLQTNRQWIWRVPFPAQWQGNLKIEIAADSAGSNIVATGYYGIEAETEAS
jgi:hypothetical protein